MPLNFLLALPSREEYGNLVCWGHMGLYSLSAYKEPVRLS